ncbi:hypothetical protein AT5A_02625 [Agrobacterium tumefaciens 5A]|nr:hypothetical protein AT5A_02625 [Agrobacterium tumefaciens 5A]
MKVDPFAGPVYRIYHIKTSADNAESVFCLKWTNR